MSIDDLLIAVTEIDAVAVTTTYSIAVDDEFVDVEFLGRRWKIEDKDEFTVAQWVYYDPCEYAKTVMVARYGTVGKDDNKIADLLNWEVCEIDGSLVHYAVRDADDYEQAIRQLEGASR